MSRGRSRIASIICVLLISAVSAPVRSQAPDPDAAHWLDAHVIPLDTTEPGSGCEDLMPLKDLIGDARIVGLGEATHGTHEFFTIKHRMVEFLVREMGFTIFALEANWPETERINQYVHTGEGDPQALLGGLYFWTWYTQEVLDLIEWVRAYNETVEPAARVSFVGFDAQAMDVALANVLAYVRAIDPAAAEQAAADYACLETYHLLVYGSPEYKPLEYGELPLEETQQCGDSVRAVYDRLVQYAHQFTAQTSEDAYNDALRNALTLVQAEEAMARRYTSGPNPRDRYMAENVSWLLAQGGPDARIILWAHNSHIMERGNAWMGGHLARMYGDDYMSFGFFFDHGSFNARLLALDTSPSAGELTTFAIDPAPDGTFGAFFRQASSPNFVLDIRDIDFGEPGAKWLRSQRQVRWIGSAYDPARADMFLMPATLETLFDFAFFVEETTASEILPRPEPE